ncbi:MAG: hydratase, partial [Christensenellales bacterium]
MIKLSQQGMYMVGGKFYDADQVKTLGLDAKALETAYQGTMAYSILSAHNAGAKTVKDGALNIKFDGLASHDITYVGIIQTAKASGLKEFPIPYVLTNCHNSLCAVGGTINEDDHVFGLSAAKKYGGIFVPPHQAVIHTYMRECMSGCG